jgi:hypothetical protein
VTFYKKSPKRRTVCREHWVELTAREKEPLAFVPECGHQTVETLLEPEGKKDGIV